MARLVEPTEQGWPADEGSAISRRSQRGMPGWAKALIVVVLLPIVGVVAIVGSRFVMRMTGGRVQTFTDSSLPNNATIKRAVEQAVASRPDFEGQVALIVEYDEAGVVDHLVVTNVWKDLREADSSLFAAAVRRQLAGIRHSARDVRVRYSYRVYKGP